MLLPYSAAIELSTFTIRSFDRVIAKIMINYNIKKVMIYMFVLSYGCFRHTYTKTASTPIFSVSTMSYVLYIGCV